MSYDDLAVLNNLARKAKAAPEKKDDSALMDRLIEANKKRDESETLVQRLMQRVSQADEEVSRLRDQIASASNEAAEWRSKCAVLEERCSHMSKPSEPSPPVQAVPNDYEQRIAEVADLRVQVARLETSAEAASRMESQLRMQITAQEARIAALMTEEKHDMPMPINGSDGYEIDVLRGGDDRIRTLKVRYT